LKQFTIHYNDNLSLEDTSIKPLEIKTYKWSNNSYRPKVEVFLCHNNEALAVKFIIFETEPRAKIIHDNGPVYKDSCVEFFFQPFPEDLRYINFEINPNGAMIMSVRKERAQKTELVQHYKHSLDLQTKIESDRWTASLNIPFDVIGEIFQAEFVPQLGDYSLGNFYKCGDETEFPHFGMWNEISGEVTNYHRIDCFGKLIW